MKLEPIISLSHRLIVEACINSSIPSTRAYWRKKLGLDEREWLDA